MTTKKHVIKIISLIKKSVDFSNKIKLSQRLKLKNSEWKTKYKIQTPKNNSGSIIT